MRQRLLELTAERIQLMSRAQAERARLSAALVPSDALAALAARVGRMLEWAARRPVLSGIAVALVVWRKPRLALNWLGRGLAMLRLYEEVRRRAVGRPVAPGFQR